MAVLVGDTIIVDGIQSTGGDAGAVATGEILSTGTGKQQAAATEDHQYYPPIRKHQTLNKS